MGSFPITITITGERIAETTSMKPAWHISRQGEIHNSDASGEETAVVMNWCSEMDDVHCYCYVPYCSGKVHTNANSERRSKDRRVSKDRHYRSNSLPSLLQTEQSVPRMLMRRILLLLVGCDTFCLLAVAARPLNVQLK